MMVGLDYYVILGVELTANDEDIKRAYRAAIKQHHPDQLEQLRDMYRSQGREGELNALIEEAKRKTQQINEAYTVLSDYTKRFYYNRRHTDTTRKSTRRTTHQRSYTRTYNTRPRQKRSAYQRSYSQDYAYRPPNEHVRQQNARTRARYVRKQYPTSPQNLHPAMPSVWSLLSLVFFIVLMGRLCTLPTTSQPSEELKNNYIQTVVANARASSTLEYDVYYDEAMRYQQEMMFPFDSNARNAIELFTESIDRQEGIVEAHRNRGLLYYAQWQILQWDALWEFAIIDLHYYNNAISTDTNVTEAIMNLCNATKKPDYYGEWCG